MANSMDDDSSSATLLTGHRQLAERVLLVSMPLASPHHPSIGLSLLKGMLAREGIGAAVRHLYLDFAEYIGPDRYDVVNDDRYFRAMIGEWLFEPFVHERDNRRPMDYLSRVLMAEDRKLLGATQILKIIETQGLIKAFLSRCLDDVAWGSYPIVGFSSCFQQSMATLAMARLVKASNPETFIVLGGANCEGEMGIEFHRRYPYIDAVVAGEAEMTFPQLVTRVLTGKTITNIPGVTVRIDGKTIVPQSSLPKPLIELDQLPELDYDEFYRDRERTPAVSASYAAVPLFETARGCWWGEKHHCTFCGLNALGMAYRSKSQKRALSELLTLGNRYGKHVLAVDNILDMRYFKHFVRELGDQSDFLIHYEVKVNLTYLQITQLSKAGIRKIQPGVESLSTNVLRLMRKGTTMIRNVQTLKFASEAGVYVEWGHLFGFPGETLVDYEQIVALIPSLTHLHPPSSIMRVRADRFSPFFNQPEAFQISIQPLPAYGHIYPFDDPTVRRLAYHFDIEKVDDVMMLGAYQALDLALQEWNTVSSTARLTISNHEDGHAEICDERIHGKSSSYVISACAQQILALTWQICGLEHVRELMSSRFDRHTVDSTIEFLIERGCLLRESSEILALPLRQPGWMRAPTKDQILTSFEVSFAYYTSKECDVVGAMS